MGSGTLICLGRCAMHGDECQHGGEGTERHGHGKEGAWVLQYGQWSPFAALSGSRCLARVVQDPTETL